MSKLFDDSDASDNEIGFELNNAYAKNYNSWRQKEELNKLKTKYGEAALEQSDDSSSSSNEDSDGALITEEFEKDFFKTLASLKNKDPNIYDENVQFFKDQSDGPQQRIKKSKNQPMFIKDYERKVLLEKDGQISENEDDTEQENSRTRSPTYMQEQKELLDDLKKGLDNVSDEEDDTFKVRAKTKEEITTEEEDYKQWLCGQKESIDDQATQNDLKPLKDFWTNPKLAENERFLRDYILNKRFLENDDKNYIPSYEEIIHDSDEGISEDEKEVQRQDEFEQKYNYRFEEPDAEFIKRYPRTMDNSVRKKDDRRKQKRAEVKDRKQKEKEQKMEEIHKMKELKRKEIEEKIQKLKEITGNTDIAFQDEDIDGDFDPEAHDRRMQNLFNDDFYQGEEGGEKPKFPELDEELEIENWDQYEDCHNEENDNKIENDNDPHCEDDDFIMDCDYDPTTSKQDLTETKGKRKRKRKSNFAKVVQTAKPIFNPDDKTYEEYLDEYYKLDCEDIIGDIPCRFKYKKVVPNSFGLSIEEILTAKDRELNRWCSLKKAVQIRPDHVEKYDVVAYQKKSTNETLKKKIFPSLYQEEPSTSSQNNTSDKNHIQGMKRKSKQLQSFKVDYAEVIKELNKIDGEQENSSAEASTTKKSDQEQEIVQKRSKKNKIKQKSNESPLDSSGTQVVQAIVKEAVSDFDEVPTKTQKPKKKNNKLNVESNNATTTNDSNKHNNQVKKKGKRKYSDTEMGKNKKNKSTNKKAKKEKSSTIDISDSRLLAFGIKPKKFKNKLKYGKKNIG